MAKWFVAAKRADFEGIGQRYGIDPVVARIIRNRDIIEEQEIDRFLNGTLAELHDGSLLKDMQKGVDIIRQNIQEQKHIRIIGDYDIDGVCATYILLRGLEVCGAIVDMAIPERVKDGYGLNDRLIEAAHEDSIDTIITCDNGIAAKEQIAYANTLGMTVVITDHHEVPYEENEEGIRNYLLPEAAAVIDPKQENCTYPFKGICGAVVAYKFIEVLWRSLQIEESVKELTGELLEFAAFATIGDIMELRDENRIIVKYGLRNMRHTRNIGLKALMEATQVAGRTISPYHIGFILGPCLNATGRLDTAKRALQLLLTQDASEAAMYAGDLKALNDNRKELTVKGVEQAIAQIEGTSLKQDNVLVVYLPDCHESIAGIIAGRVRERYGKPTFILTRGEEEVKGSGRSIEAFSMYEEMCRHAELFLKFGGHRQAAGLSMKEENVEQFRRRMNEGSTLTQEDFEEKLHIDVPMPISYITKELVAQLERLEPFGNGNSKPVFAQKNVTILNCRIMGKNQNVARFTVREESGAEIAGIYFGDMEKLVSYQGRPVSICYYPTLNEFRGNQSLQIVIQDILS